MRDVVQNAKDKDLSEKTNVKLVTINILLKRMSNNLL